MHKINKISLLFLLFTVLILSSCSPKIEKIEKIEKLESSPECPNLIKFAGKDILQTQAGKDACLSEIGLKQDNSAICEKIKTPRSRFQCLGVTKRDFSQCDKVQGTAD
ncbi:hypothetical protein HYX00_04275, partial [Candidatus Woesearchaeota archaeon]|nr:hypothetical protein [Candidatus Woesearchaeota archaeon]